jgi:hypothetical protein
MTSRRCLSGVIAIVGAMTFFRASSQAAPQEFAMTGGGRLSLQFSGDDLSVSITGTGPGLASLCLATGSHVRILHASAALGEAVFERAGDAWTLRRGFDWQLRDTPAAPQPTELESNAFFARNGWIANASRAGSPRRDFRIRLQNEPQFLAIAFLRFSDPPAMSYWPHTVADDCTLSRVAQGDLPESASFKPGTWERVEPRGL